MFPGDLPGRPRRAQDRTGAARCRAFPALPAAAREPRQPIRRGAGRCRTSGSTAPSSSCSETGSHERDAAQAAGVRRRRSGARRRAAAGGGARRRRHRTGARARRAAGPPDARGPRPARPALGHCCSSRRWPARRSWAPAAWFARLVSAALVRDDWIGWTTLALLLVAAFAALMLLLRELIGFFRLARLGRLKADVAAAIRERDQRRERKAALRLAGLYAGRPDVAWSVRRFREHARDVHDPGELLALADRDLVAPLDVQGTAPHHPLGQARRHRHGALAHGADRGRLCADREPAPAARAGHALRRPPRLRRRAAARAAWCSPTSSPPAASP